MFSEVFIMNKKILLVAIIILALDQISKAIIDITMKFGQSFNYYFFSCLINYLSLYV